jgi:putative ABC transport system permease protein
LYRQRPIWAITTLTAITRGAGSTAQLMDAVRQRVSAIDATIPADLVFLHTHAQRVTASRRFAMTVLGAFGAVSLLLAAIGVYGVLSFSVAQRTREMAVRAALGADRGRLLRLVLGNGARVVLAGTVAGLAGALLLTRLVESMLFEVSPRDPIVLAIATLTIAASGTLASVFPARRATRVEPMAVLRGE